MPSIQPGVAPHVVRPRRHGAPGFDVHAAFAWHCRQFPPTHTRSTPQAMPVGAAGPSTQLAVPDPHRTTPCTHGELGLPEHVAPSSQVMHMPELVQTWPVPHDEPAGRGRVEFAHDDAAPHTVSPSTHWSVLVEQGVPGVQVTQSPPRQTRLFPQLTPAAEAGPSMHDDMPFWQNVTPVRQGAPVFPVHGWLS